MCGIAGFVNVKDPETRLKLVHYLGHEIDYRGKDASGYISLNGKVRTGRTLGAWDKASDDFKRNAAAGQHAVLHARYATCDRKDRLQNAHPFSIHRAGRPILHGVHNGMIPDAWNSAKKHKRTCRVDSKELFELITDDAWDEVTDLSGYGAIAYSYHADPTHIYLGRLSSGADLSIFEAEDGSIIFGSTDWVVKDACKAAGVNLKGAWQVETGVIYTAGDKGLRYSGLDGITFKPYVYKYVAPKVPFVLAGGKSYSTHDERTYETHQGNDSDLIGQLYEDYLAEHPDEWGKEEAEVLDLQSFNLWMAGQTRDSLK